MAFLVGQTKARESLRKGFVDIGRRRPALARMGQRAARRSGLSRPRSNHGQSRPETLCQIFQQFRLTEAIPTGLAEPDRAYAR